MIDRTSRFAREERRREEVWLAGTNEAAHAAMDRYSQLAVMLGVPPRARRAFVSAALEAARQYQMACMYANYERRTGHPYPHEGHVHDDVVSESAWLGELERMRACLEQEA
jgi:hypothetical protein